MARIPFSETIGRFFGVKGDQPPVTNTEEVLTADKTLEQEEILVGAMQEIQKNLDWSAHGSQVKSMQIVDSVHKDFNPRYLRVELLSIGKQKEVLDTIGMTKGIIRSTAYEGAIKSPQTVMYFKVNK